MARKHGTVQNGRPRERGLIIQIAQQARKRDPKWNHWRTEPRLAEALRQIRIFPYTAWRASGPDARQSVAGMEACAAETVAGDGTCTADSSSASIPFRTPPRNLRGYGLPTSTSLPGCGMARKRGLEWGKRSQEMEPAQPTFPANLTLSGHRHETCVATAFRQVHTFPDVAWRASAVWSGENGRRRWACAADSSSESIPFRISPYSPPNRGLPTSTCLPGCGMAHKRDLEWGKPRAT